ncbi:hypothetical protein AMTRI_Chr13g85480 [Amborella trichopoda]|uniref:Uncharacterized protein n=1 Tax=Amborella trichopoda TaxID=13333 RepID=W1P8R9_AMBTC|nr:uncharacterized protein LOC18432153 [Amborella trichopoda]ERN04001.1 hypothetical protein AMTR_s00079p00155780 [Amborella trichopoda]|eukprot:XP_006842326.1 uncharacterized protein LOC18432153 [Amborella trichopoda]
MAIDLCSESSGWPISPRISFSYDLSQNDCSSPHREDTTLLNRDPSSDFDFCISLREEVTSSSADELFFDGKILPLQPRKPEAPKIEETLKPPVVEDPTLSKKESLKEIMESETKPASKSFWNFRRSSSMNSGNKVKQGLMGSITGLYRSNSTGSSNPKENSKTPSRKPIKAMVSPEEPKKEKLSFKEPKLVMGKKRQGIPRPPLQGNYSGYSGIRISPVLNVPSPCVSKGVNGIFGFGYFICRKEKNRKKPSENSP